jgi:hypothetical protein
VVLDNASSHITNRQLLYSIVAKDEQVLADKISDYAIRSPA